MSKKLCIISDLHCGHKVGLTPPKYQEPLHQRNKHLANLARYQRRYWNFYTNAIDKHGPFDVVFDLGDNIDGKGERSGGTEQITCDRNQQCETAVECITRATGKQTESLPSGTIIAKRDTGARLIMVKGTPAHVGSDEDTEEIVANLAGAEKIGAHEYVDIEGVVFDLKHQPAGGSQVPHGRHTGIARDRLWNLLWNDAANFPKADVLLRGHVHYFNYCGGPDWLAMTLPALQGLGSKYGTLRCSGIVDFGIVIFTIDDGAYTWHAETLKVQASQSVIRL